MVIIRLPTLWEPRWYSDEGTFTTVAWVHSLGVPLYSGVFDVNPPGIYWLYGVLLRLGADQHHLVVQSALLLAVLASAFCVLWIATQWLGPNLGLAAGLLAAAGLSLPTLDGDLLNIEIAALPFFLAALLSALRRGNGSAFVAGILTACAVLIRPSYALDSLAILVGLSAGFTTARRLVIALVGGLFILGAALVALTSGNELTPYVEQAMPLQRAYVIWANGGTIFPLILRLSAALIIAIAWYWRVRHVVWRPMAVWLPASVAAASITPRELSHYSIEVIPPLAIGIVMLGGLAWRRVGTHQSVVRLAGPALMAPLALLSLVAAAEATLVLPARQVALMHGTPAPPPFLHNFSYVSLPGYYGRWASWVVGHPLRGQDLHGFPGPFGAEQAEARLVDRLAAGSIPRIQVLGDRAWVYFLSRLPPATRFVAMNSGYRLVPGADAVVDRALAQHQAELVTVADIPRTPWLQRLESYGFEKVADTPWPTYRGTPSAHVAISCLAASSRTCYTDG